VPRGSFFDDDAKRRTTAVIREIESETAAEVVVAVRPRASQYVGTTLLFAGACALVAFLVMWFSPVVYAVETIPLDVALTFAVAAAIAHFSDFVKRRFTSRSGRDSKVASGCEYAFTHLGISKTKDRTGLLVFVCLLENSVRIRPDIGIDVTRCEQELSETRVGLEAAVRARDVDRFLELLRTLAKPLAAQLPRLDGDVNELSDAVA
jgi:putative membrane protein